MGPAVRALTHRSAAACVRASCRGSCLAFGGYCVEVAPGRRPVEAWCCLLLGARGRTSYNANVSSSRTRGPEGRHHGHDDAEHEHGSHEHEPAEGEAAGSTHEHGGVGDAKHLESEDHDHDHA